MSRGLSDRVEELVKQYLQYLLAAQGPIDVSRLSPEAIKEISKFRV